MQQMQLLQYGQDSGKCGLLLWQEFNDFPLSGVISGVDPNCPLFSRPFSRDLEKCYFATLQRLYAAKSDFWREKGGCL